MMVAKLTRKNGYHDRSIRFIMGTESELSSQNHQFKLDLPEDLLECLGSPEIRFLDNKLIVSFSSYNYGRNALDVNFGWEIGEAGFKELGADEVSLLAAEKQLFCSMGDIFAEDIKSEELVELANSFIDQQFQCTEDRNYFYKPVFCSMEGLNNFCY